MKMQNLNPKETSTGLTQKTLIPQVRYHPTIQTQTLGAQARTTKTRTSHSQKSIYGAECPLQTGSQGGDNTAQVNPVPVKPGSDEGQKQKPSSQKPSNKPKQKLDQRGATDPDPPQKLVQKGPPRPEHIPLGLGVQLDRGVVEEVEVLTRGQRINQDWFSWRKNRITASVAHRIAHCRFVNGKSRTPPPSYLAAITGDGPRVQTRAMCWGVEMEAEVVRRYQRLKSSALERSISVQDCGLFIDTRHPWLAASPDGIVTDSQTGQRLLCLEVKCPYKHRHRRVEDACRDDPAFCLQIQAEAEDGRESGGAPVYRLKRSHSYFTQIQCQLAVTGLIQADLVVFTLKETAIVPVTFDPNLWEETVTKLEVFYRDAVLPKLREKTGPGSAAAWTPEH
ncbi:uncharacterized protein LOC113174083 [Anabas testudineus]|uniref:YqaJ viral recombinase domain-containing protein n=1 Tax=Anabas testudineus TaxID=64144 RepID=A0A3Q1J497_ANATE|nr:uncharacterized protein LOC113174083 [Anabas testudineus]